MTTPNMPLQARLDAAPPVDKVEALGYFVLRALRAGATCVIVDRAFMQQALSLPVAHRSTAALTAQRPGQWYDFWKDTWVNLTPDGRAEDGKNLPCMGFTCYGPPDEEIAPEGPGEAAIHASDPSGLRATR